MFTRPTLIRESVYDHLRDAILNGEFLPAERLGEVELTERLGVSRTPIREAIGRLTQDGLLESTPGRGVRIRVVSALEARDAYLVRETLDGLAAALAAKAHTSADAAALVATLKELDAAGSEDYREQTRLDLAFHRHVAQAAHNLPLLDLARDLEQRIALVKHQTRVYNSHPQTTEQHRAILQAVLDHDEAAAREHAMSHVRTFAALVMENLGVQTGLEP
ncbi:GntR family transcriptional regulator [Deinococcus radiomollis]|uniref:GntR family transcriptional regulator n=1 Tax=Deinococcus radiomollis TaxID=468916 RepID=UPI0038919F4C